MKWDELELIWRRQDLPIGSDADTADLLRTFEKKHRRQAAALALRDWSEAAAGVLVAFTLGYIAWHMGRVGRPIWLAVVPILGVTAFFVRERVRARQRRRGPGLPMLAQIEGDIVELKHQRRLLSRVAIWYLAPIAAAIAIVIATVCLQSPAWAPTRNPLFIAGMTLFQAGILFGAWVINQRTVRKQIDPRLVELDKLREQFSDPEPQP